MLHFWKLSTKTIFTTTSTLLKGNSNLSFQQTRNTYILKRKYPTRLFKKDDTVRKLTRKDFYYELLENTEIRKKSKLNVILLENVKGFGNKGETISLKRKLAYEALLLPKLAVYATPENIEKYGIIDAKEEFKYNSKFVPATLQILERCCLIVHMSKKNNWKLEKWHIRANFRWLGIELTDETITMPKNIICGPNLEYQGKEFYVTITINKTESVNVRCRLFHITSDTHVLPTNELDLKKIPGTAIFPEDQPILDLMPRPKWEDNSVKN